MSAKTLISVEEFDRLEEDEFRYELDDGIGCNILFVLGANTKRAPDVSVVLREVGSVKEITGAPNIAAEILSPSNSKREMKRKLGQFFATGKLAWIIDPKTRTVEVWESAAGPARTLRASDSLETPLLPGFDYPIARLF